MIQLLLIEDCEQHRADAEVALKAAGFNPGRELVEGEVGMYYIAKNLSLALQFLECGKYDAILSDIFMPDTKRSETLIPGGVSIALRAEELGIPFVLCTDGYHHGDQYDWIHRLGMHRGWPSMVDNYSVQGTGKKDWPLAIQNLLELVAARNGGG